MPSLHLRVHEIPESLREAIQLLQERLEMPLHFTDEVVADAELAARQSTDDHADFTHVEFVTIDPPTSKDLDQAIQIEREGAGYLVRYAISDVPHFVRPGTALEAETHRRGMTKYAPSARIPLHPAVISEDAGSLLADGKPRPAFVWELHLDAGGEVVDVGLTRALVESRAKLNYEGVQADFDGGTPHASIALLPEVGKLRQQLEIERGGVSLNLPDQEIVERDGTWELEFRALVPVENWNAQISLMTGFAAAQTMLTGKVGVLRTLPPAEEWSLQKLRRAVRSLGVPWPKEMPYPEFVRSLSPKDPRQLAALTKCTMLFRGAGYLAFDGEVPDENLLHAALAAPYAHTTAPLRRLVDRYVLAICHALINGLEVPQWARDGLAALPEEMAETGRSARAYERGVIDLTEGLVLSNRVGAIFTGVVTDVDPKTHVGTVQIAEPAVELRVPAKASEVGSEVRVRVDKVDVRKGQVTLSRPN
ncbi:RNB domain-containing ribonuclease [Tessaracoccus sp. MC1865]|uniref:RNB domain-containing ribonuclease n=1 Tax=Tessaracoccus sp. MC1865 TaxID=2760310 RepID=UPI00160112CE|nr:RNB domain-containing ribonuclease [Tessaracoccus sp. MC1865]MBB1483694.1 RNB domain-containing ribonuclease [Tessaracoccus sp. MC1865]QTO36764.1 RNB domain-containing ribonuclease [Tessaracoccus sp. MC1865]